MIKKTLAIFLIIIILLAFILLIIKKISVSAYWIIVIAITLATYLLPKINKK